MPMQMQMFVEPHSHPLRRLAIGIVCAALVACGGGDSAGPRPSAAPERKSALAAAPLSAGQWSPLIPLSLVPAAAANLPNGKVLLWSSYERLAFGGSGKTYTAEFDPVTQSATEALVTQTGHDMFCPGTTNLSDGSILVNGGDDSNKTSLYNALTGTWSTGPTMKIGRGYQANTLLADGGVLTFGGSWNGGYGRKNAELWTASGGWRLLSGVPIGPAVGPDPGGVYRGDNHIWLTPAPNGQVFQSGPSANMNWIDTSGNGRIVGAGQRGNDGYSQNGNAVSPTTWASCSRWVVLACLRKRRRQCPRPCDRHQRRGVGAAGRLDGLPADVRQLGRPAERAGGRDRRSDARPDFF